MKKKLALLITASAVTSLAIAAIALSPKALNKAVKGDPSYTMVLDGNTDVVDVDGGILHQANIKNNKIDVVGYTQMNGYFGTIKQQTYGQYTYNGLVYNRSAINGLISIKVTYDGAQLSYTFTEFLMENMNWSTYQPIVSGTTYNAPAGSGYFVIARPGSNEAAITRIEITYACQGDIDNQMIFNKNTTLGGARSLAGKTVTEDSYIELTNKPTKNTNNYSRGNHVSASHDDSWYRWNGRYFDKSASLGTRFKFGLTVIGEYSRMTDPDKVFHYAVWPQFDYGNSSDRPWVQTYIGNDNFDPLGRENTLHPEEALTYDTYTGRYYGAYDYVNLFRIKDSSSQVVKDAYGNTYHFYTEQEANDFINNVLLVEHPTETYTASTYYDYVFANPETTNIAGGGYTLKSAYERYELPFWFMVFDIYLDADNDPVCDIYINGMLIYSDTIFYSYDKVGTPDINIWTMPLHVVNYGTDIDATPDEAYTGCFTYPRLIED